MSTQTNSYITYGVKHKYKEADDLISKNLEKEFIRILGDTFTASKLYHVTLYR